MYIIYFDIALFWKMSQDSLKVSYFRECVYVYVSIQLHKINIMVNVSSLELGILIQKGEKK